VAALTKRQQNDGGWRQLPGLESDAYATGQAFVALALSQPIPPKRAAR
jgi:hypothetical protein